MKIPNRVKMFIQRITNTESLNTVLNEIKNAESVMTVYRTKKQEYKIYHTGLAEDNFTTLLILLSRHIGIFDFLKLAIIITELYRKDDGLEGFEFTPKALEIIEWKKNNYNQQKIDSLS